MVPMIMASVFCHPRDLVAALVFGIPDSDLLIE